MQEIALQRAGYYPLDNTAMIHIATLGKTYSNVFRLSVSLTEYIDANILQSALDTVTPRFPTIVAGVKAVGTQYVIVPIISPLRVKCDGEKLASFTKEEMNDCAMRVFYGARSVSVEFFHSLTDGHGGLVFLNTLLTRYLCKKYGITVAENSFALNPADNVAESEIRDDYSFFAKRGKSSFSYCPAYKLSGEKSKDDAIQTITGVFDLNALLKLSHEYNVKLTAFLTAVLTESIFELQNNVTCGRMSKMPIRIMIPVDMRRHYQSKTVRNFILYVMTKTTKSDYGIPFEKLVNKLNAQITEQNKD